MVFYYLETVRQSAFVAKSKNFERGEAKKTNDMQSNLVNFFRKATAEICGLEQKWDCRTVSFLVVNNESHSL